MIGEILAGPLTAVVLRSNRHIALDESLNLFAAQGGSG
jgi:hypothetical protein